MRNVLFWLCLAGSFLACQQIVGRVLRPGWKVPAPPRRNTEGWYLSTYGDIGLDYYVLRFGLCGCGQFIREADVLCLSSSKGLYGLHAALLGEKLSRPNRPVRVYNLSFSFGESFHYPMEVIKTLDLRDKVLLADLTDNTLDYHLSGMARLALECSSAFEARKIVWEKWLGYERDRLFTGSLPKVVYSREKGFRTGPYITTAQNFRQISTGNLEEVAARRTHWARPGKSPAWTFHYDELREPFFEECRKRNLRIIFTSIPYEDYAPEWARAIAEDLGYLYAGVAPDGIELSDPYHMSTKGRTLFCQRLGERLGEEKYGIVKRSSAD